MEPLPQAEEILNRLSCGESLRSICNTKGFPTEAAVRFRVVRDQPPGFAAQYACARQAGLDWIAEDIQTISEERSDDANSRRVRIDARKWLLSKLRPDKYGDSVRQEITGAGGGPLTVAVVYEDRPPKLQQAAIDIAPETD